MYNINYWISSLPLKVLLPFFRIRTVNIMEILHSVPYTSRVNRVMHIGKTGKKKKKCCRISNTQRLINCLFCICFSMYTLSLDLVLFFSCECRIQCEPQSDLSSCCSDVLWISSATFDTPVSFAFNYFGSEPARDRVNRFPPPLFPTSNHHQRVSPMGKGKPN